jgi:hypothetical protein
MVHPGKAEHALLLVQQQQRQESATPDDTPGGHRLVWCECGCGAVVTELEVARVASVRARVEAHLRRSIGGIAMRAPKSVPFEMLEQMRGVGGSGY